jgi:hypothetical protein
MKQHWRQLVPSPDPPTSYLMLRPLEITCIKIFECYNSESAASNYYLGSCVAEMSAKSCIYHLQSFENEGKFGPALN